MEAVADHLGRHRFVGQHRPGESRGPVRQRRHPVEEMRGVTGAGVDGRQRLLEGGGRMAERHAVSRGDQPGDEVERAVEFRRQCDQPHRGAVRVDHRDDGRPGEGALVRQRLAGARRQTQAAGRLRAVVVGIEEVALERRAEDAGRAGARRRHGGVDGRQEPLERLRGARYRRRAERGDAVARQRHGHAGHGVGAAEHVGAVDAVDVAVDEAGQDPLPVARDVIGRCAGVGGDLGDDAVLDRQRRALEDAVGGDDAAAAQPDHAAGVLAPIMPARRRPSGAPRPRP
jgi:hypothetical protein